MARYIDADTLLQNLKKQYGEDLGWQCTVNMSDVGMMVEDTPTADVEEVKHGHWVSHSPDIATMRVFHKLGIGKGMSENSIFWTCSCCDSWGTPSQKRCSECGAKMDGEKPVNYGSSKND